MNIARIMIPKCSTVFLHEKDTVRTMNMKVLEQRRLESIIRRDFCPVLPIDASLEQVVSAALNQNFVPIVDGRNVLCGILTRRIIIKYLSEFHDCL